MKYAYVQVRGLRPWLGLEVQVDLLVPAVRALVEKAGGVMPELRVTRVRAGAGWAWEEAVVEAWW